MNLADKYIKFEKTAGPDTTVNDFFDHCGVPMKQRTDFAYAAIMKQVLEKTSPRLLIKEKKVKFEMEFTVDENNPDTSDFLLYFEERINEGLLNEELILENDIPVRRTDGENKNKGGF